MIDGGMGGIPCPIGRAGGGGGPPEDVPAEGNKSISPLAAFHLSSHLPSPTFALRRIVRLVEAGRAHRQAGRIAPSLHGGARNGNFAAHNLVAALARIRRRR